MKILESYRYLEVCKRLLDAEMSAAEIYAEAIGSFHDDPENAVLIAIRSGHDENIDCLSDHLVFLGGDSNSRVESATFPKAVEGVSMTFGESAVLMALEAGEAAALEDYRSALSDPEVPTSFKSDIRGKLVPHLERHVAELEKLRSQPASAAEAGVSTETSEILLPTSKG